MDEIIDPNQLQKQIIRLRIMLQNVCDGFSAESANKQLQLNLKHKVLFAVADTPNCSPQVLIRLLGIAKSNLALLCKDMTEEGLLAVGKSESDGRAIFYNLTEKGQAELQTVYDKLGKQLCPITDRELRTMNRKLEQVIQFLNKKYLK